MIRLERRFIAGLLLVLVTAAVSPAQEKKPFTLQVAYGALSPSRFPYMAAKQAKLYEKYGLAVN